MGGPHVLHLAVRGRGVPTHIPVLRALKLQDHAVLRGRKVGREGASYACWGSSSHQAMVKDRGGLRAKKTYSREKKEKERKIKKQMERECVG